MKLKLTLAFSALLLIVTLAYSNYFPSGFGFDDLTIVRDNTSIRSLVNIPRFFVDTSTSSIDPQDYVYRPVLTTSFAIDYFLAQGMNPWVFHLATLLYLLGGLAVIAWLCFVVYQHIYPHPWNAYLGIMAAALVGVHPAVTGIMNSLNHRGELLAAIGVAAGVALYGAQSEKRRFGLYLIPPTLGILADPAGLIFGPMLLAYILLIEPAKTDEGETLSDEQLRSRDETQTPIEVAAVGTEAAPKRIRIRRRKHPFRLYVKAQLKRFTPALFFTAAAALFESSVTPFPKTDETVIRYWFTQPWVALHYFQSFFAPVRLSPISDLRPFTGYDIHAVFGLAFVLALISLVIILAISRPWRPAVFGLWWFLIGMLPGAMLARPEVENDSRMFLPFIGLALALTWTARMMLPSGEPLRRLQAIAAGILFVFMAYATHARNHVWNQPEALWSDAVYKNPKSPEALRRYALTLLANGKLSQAFESLRDAKLIDDKSPDIETAMGMVTAALNLTAEAEMHFTTAKSYGADRYSIYVPYGQYLEKQNQKSEALGSYNWGAALAPTDLRPWHGMMRVYSSLYDWNNLAKTVEDARKLDAHDPVTASFASVLQSHRDAVKSLEELVKKDATAENYVKLSEANCLVGRNNECLEAAQKAVKLNPNDSHAYTALGSAYLVLGRLDEAIQAVNKALRLDPENKVAWTNKGEYEQLKRVVSNRINRVE